MGCLRASNLSPFDRKDIVMVVKEVPIAKDPKDSVVGSGKIVEKVLVATPNSLVASGDQVIINEDNDKVLYWSDCVSILNVASIDLLY
ncbi:hypothetical protein ACH5RR_015528 [Cinchona calisaya]|uniref:Uncharacterized protein n=1 Tax=Cinchona calisaya TaxID=153742 RepID=A0ABD2ZU93_9GENT